MAGRGSALRVLLGTAGLLLLLLTALLGVLFVVAWAGGVDFMPLLIVPTLMGAGLLVIAAKGRG